MEQIVRPETVEIVEIVEAESNQQSTQTIYDPDAPHSLTLEVEDDDAKYEITQIYTGLPDHVLEEYDRLREVLLEAEGQKTDVKTNTVEADEYLFKELCSDVKGYDGEKPSNWHDLIDYEEKKFGINKLLAIKIVNSSKEKPVKARKWGSVVSSNSVTIKFYGNDGRVLTRTAHFKGKSPADLAAYNVIKSRISLVEQDLDDSAIKIPASMKKKAELFDKINPEVVGYQRIPLHHKAAFVTGLFDAKISSTEKK